MNPVTSNRVDGSPGVVIQAGEHHGDIHIHNPPPVDTGGGGLPGQTDHFTGRGETLDELVRRVDAQDPAVSAVYVVNGMPGVGKTAFVIHAAHELADRYPDGAIFLDLLGFTAGQEALSTSQALSELLSQSGVPRSEIPTENGPKRAMWQRFMRGRRTLIVLDNARDTEQVEPLLPGATGCLTLITARSKLYDLDATPLPLEVLSAGEARKLFVEVAGSDRGQDAVAVDRIVSACHRLPLAVRLMASRARHLHADPLEEIADDVESLPGESKIRGVFGLSYDNLGERLQRAFRLLGCYPGVEITAEAMAALADLSPSGGRRLLRGLTECSLMDRRADETGERAGVVRYRLHDLLRDYARSRAVEEEPPAALDAAIDRLITYYRTMVQAVSRLHQGENEAPPEVTEPALPDAAHARAWLIAERENILACIDAVPALPAELPATMAVLLSDMCYWPEAIRCHQRARAVYRDIGDRSGEADALQGIAHRYRLIGDYPSAQQHYEQALAVYRDVADRRGEAYVLVGMADLDRLLGDHDEARHRYQQGLATYRDIADRRGVANTLRGLADVDRLLGQYAQAREGYQQAYTIYRDIGDQLREAYALRRLADVDVITGCYDQARDRYLRAHTIHGEVGNRIGQGYGLLGLADVDLMTGDRAQARERYQQALASHRDIGNRHGEASALAGLGDVDHLLGNHEQARECYQQACASYRDIGDRFGEADALRRLGAVAEATADPDTAREHWQAARRIYQELRVPVTKLPVPDALAEPDPPNEARHRS